MRRILVGTDFSTAGTRAVQVAFSFAQRTGASLRVVHVVPPRRWLMGLGRKDLSTLSHVHRRASAALKRLAEKLDPSRQNELSTGLVSGAASVAIERAADDFDADLLVIGARGEHQVRGRKLTLGGTALKLLSTTSIPLLVVRKTGQRARSILAAVDLTPVSKDVLHWARTSAAEGEKLIVFHAYGIPFAERLDAYGVAKEAIQQYTREEHDERERKLRALAGARGVRLIIERGDAIDLLFKHIEKLEPGLIVVGKHSKRRRSAGWSGSLARHVALFAPGNVLIVVPRRSRRLTALLMRERRGM